MKWILSFISVFYCSVLFSQTGAISVTGVSPLAAYSEKWNDIKYNSCNTAVGSTFMSSKEKEVIYILNLIRTNPALFAKTVLKKYPSVSEKDYLTDNVYYYKSLVDALLTLKPQELFYPDEKCWRSAQCHAYSSGLSGYIGHQRQTKICKIKKNYQGECCDYGNADPLDIVLSLLIDEGVPSLGHRYLLLNNYSKVGISIQPHKKYGTNTVIDFYY